MAHDHARYIDGHWYIPVGDLHEFRTALVRVMAHSDPLPGEGTDEAWDAALALLSEEDKRQVFGS